MGSGGGGKKRKKAHNIKEEKGSLISRIVDKKMDILRLSILLDGYSLRILDHNTNTKEKKN